MSRIAVVGGGITGSAIATWLISAGHEVTLFEPEPDGLPASSGNAALIALPEIAPLATPGLLRSLPGWLLDPLGPLAVRWRDLPALAPWLAAFVRSATPARGTSVRRALTGLMATALQDHETLAAKAGLFGHLRQTGYLAVHDSEGGLKRAVAEAAAVRDALGFDFERLPAPAARRLVPQLEGPFAGAVYQPVYWMVSDPLDVLRHYQSFTARWGTLVAAGVAALRPGENGIAVVTRTGEESIFDKVVVAAGVWSRDLVRGLGLEILLETERGYNTTFSDPGWTLPMPLGFADHGFVATPLLGGLRVGGGVELAAPEAAPNFKRAKAMRDRMRAYVPALPQDGREWMGRRPSTPDSLPVISRHPRDGRLLFALGAGHLGLTLSAVTARLIARLVAGDAGADDLRPFDIARFQKGRRS